MMSEEVVVLSVTLMDAVSLVLSLILVYLIGYWSGNRSGQSLGRLKEREKVSRNLTYFAGRRGIFSDITVETLIDMTRRNA